MRKRPSEPWSSEAKATVAAAVLRNPIWAAGAILGGVGLASALRGKPFHPFERTKELLSAAATKLDFRAPVYEAPDITVENRPTFEAPTFEAPTFEAPTFQAPTFQAPVFPSFGSGGVPPRASPQVPAPSLPQAPSLPSLPPAPALPQLPPLPSQPPPPGAREAMSPIPQSRIDRIDRAFANERAFGYTPPAPAREPMPGGDTQGNFIETVLGIVPAVGIETGVKFGAGLVAGGVESVGSIPGVGLQALGGAFGQASRSDLGKQIGFGISDFGRRINPEVLPGVDDPAFQVGKNIGGFVRLGARRLNEV